MLRGNLEQPRPGGGWSRIGTVERLRRHESRRARLFSFESVGSLAYDGGLRSDKCEIPVQSTSRQRAGVLFGQIERHMGDRKRPYRYNRDPVIDSMAALQAYNDRADTTI